MGKATWWFKGLLGKKKDKETVQNINSICGGKEEKNRRSFAASANVSGGLTQIPDIIPAEADSAWLRSYIADSEKEQKKHAVVVAAATASAADAAIAAAQAAVAVVRLTSRGKGALLTGSREKLAAVRIQTVFRGFLARKARRALKGLVKLQALVRGYLVRKRAAATLHSMQALIRTQTAVRAQRARLSINNNRGYQPEIRPRKSIERLSSCYGSNNHSSPNTFDEIPKIVEMDTCRPESRSRRIHVCTPEYGDDHYYHAISSPLTCLCPDPARLSIPDCGHLQDFDWGFVTEDHEKSTTAQNTPRFSSSARVYGPITPSKSLCGDSYFRPLHSNCPNYMANTQSFRAKLRSLSAPRKRPELVSKMRPSLNEIMAASRSSFSGVRMRRSSCSQTRVF